MAWPTPSAYNTDAFDSGNDDIGGARLMLYDTCVVVQQIIAARGTANGVASLGADGKVPAAELGTFDYYLAPSLEAIGALTPATDKLPYFTDSTLAALTPFTAFARTVLATADAVAARTVLGLSIGTHVQAFSAGLTVAAAALAEAGTTGLLRKDADGHVVLDAEQYMTDANLALYATMEWVNSLIEALQSSDNPFEQYLQYNDLYGVFATVEDVTRSQITHCISTSYTPWIQSNIGTGSVSAISSDASRNGVVGLKSGTAAGDGSRLYTASAAIVLRAGTYFESVAAFVTTTDTQAYIGFMSTQTSTAPVSGAYFHLSGGSVTAKATKSSTTTTAGSSFTPTASVYYRLRITVAPGFTSVRYEIYQEDGTSVYDVSLATDIPNAATDTVGDGIIVWTTGTTAVTVANVDLLKHYLV